jgi:hypothetical protein
MTTRSNNHKLEFKKCVLKVKVLRKSPQHMNWNWMAVAHLIQTVNCHLIVEQDL